MWGSGVLTRSVFWSRDGVGFWSRGGGVCSGVVAAEVFESWRRSCVLESWRRGVCSGVVTVWGFWSRDGVVVVLES